ncbi:MAG TPA: hypothetical protein VK198_02620 [Terriglobales bacterium]|nr:hypothetical protein [Terriglobales bacterium]
MALWHGVNILRRVKTSKGWANVALKRNTKKRIQWPSGGSFLIEWRENGSRLREAAGNTPAEALDWGFPPEHLDAVRKLSEGGVMLWWFAADWAVARRKFIERGYPLVQAFDIQIRKIESALPEINALFGSHVVYALPSTGIYTHPEIIWKSMLDTLAGPGSKHRFHARRG